ncbi:hypothetical protein HDE_02579 [Halotydeus destructor]|nr:hypothetical protein HDE_02579 [Halotydeus destructor]
MGIWFRYWSRKYLRNFMRPIGGDVAQVWHRRLTFAYIFIATNAFGVMYYQYSQKKNSGELFQDKTDAHYFARTLRLKNPEVYTFTWKDGFVKHEMTEADFPDGIMPPEMFPESKSLPVIELEGKIPEVDFNKFPKDDIEVDSDWLKQQLQ